MCGTEHETVGMGVVTSEFNLQRGVLVESFAAGPAGYAALAYVVHGVRWA